MSREKRLWPTPRTGGDNGTVKHCDLSGYVKASLSPSFPAGSPVNLTALQEAVREVVMSVTSGQSSGELLARLDHDGSWVKMYQEYSQATLDGSLEKFSLIWPKWGTLLDGVLSELSTWVHSIDATEYSLWPTPDCSDRRSVKSKQQGLSNAVKLFPTPTSRDHKDTGDCANVPENRLLGRAVHPSVEHGSLNPDWVEWLMGYPIGWTNLKESQELQLESNTELTDLNASETP